MAITAYLNNDGKYTSFSFGDTCIRFRTPENLERYTQVKCWDNGYIVTMAKYKNHTNDEEEYIDLQPILENLYFDVTKTLEPITEVKIK